MTNRLENNFATTAFWLGMAALASLFFVAGPFFAILAIVFGYLGSHAENDGYAKVGIVLGCFVIPLHGLMILLKSS
jgi:hypothetical protein